MWPPINEIEHYGLNTKLLKNNSNLEITFFGFPKHLMFMQESLNNVDLDLKNPILIVE